MKKNFTTFILIMILLAGISLLLYPSVSNYWNSFFQSRAIATYAEEVAVLDDTDYESLIEAAREYNKTLLHKNNRYILSDEEKQEYESLLNVSGLGIIGYIEIPSIKCSLPIYHGTDDDILQVAIGHIEGTSLPVGGESTHSVLSGHRGLPRAKLFTDLDQLEKGDVFMMRVLDEALTYEVDQIRIVEPTELQDLEIEEGKDLCTLVTCTPYGINSHRLLVRGHRVENLKDASSIRVTADAQQIDFRLVAMVLAAVILMVLFVWMMVHSGKKR